MSFLCFKIELDAVGQVLSKPCTDGISNVHIHCITRMGKYSACNFKINTSCNVKRNERGQGNHVCVVED